MTEEKWTFKNFTKDIGANILFFLRNVYQFLIAIILFIIEVKKGLMDW